MTSKLNRQKFYARSFFSFVSNLAVYQNFLASHSRRDAMHEWTIYQNDKSIEEKGVRWLSLIKSVWFICQPAIWRETSPNPFEQRRATARLHQNLHNNSKILNMDVILCLVLFFVNEIQYISVSHDPLRFSLIRQQFFFFFFSLVSFIEQNQYNGNMLCHEFCAYINTRPGHTLRTHTFTRPETHCARIALISFNWLAHSVAVAAVARHNTSTVVHVHTDSEWREGHVTMSDRIAKRPLLVDRSTRLSSNSVEAETFQTTQFARDFFEDASRAIRPLLERMLIDSCRFTSQQAQTRHTHTPDHAIIKQNCESEEGTAHIAHHIQLSNLKWFLFFGALAWWQFTSENMQANNMTTRRATMAFFWNGNVHLSTWHEAWSIKMRHFESLFNNSNWLGCVQMATQIRQMVFIESTFLETDDCRRPHQMLLKMISIRLLLL